MALHKEKIKDWYRMQLILLGVRTKKVLTGPWHVQIDLTNACNNNCVGCWCHSPMLEELAMDAETKKKFIPFDVAKKLINDLASMGTREIYFTGGGEPFMHPQTIELIEYVKSKGLRCDMSNNFTLLNQDKIKRIVQAGMDNMNCSIWAGSASAYVKTHPNKTEADFEKIVERFETFNHEKKRLGTSKPTLRIYNVISSLNWDDFDNMLEFAHRVKADGIDFTPTDIIPGKTDSLMLDQNQTGQLADKLKRIRPQLANLERKYSHRIYFHNYDQFLRRLESTNTQNGVYDESIIGTMPCYAGWTFLRILADGNVNSCLKTVRMPIGNIFEDSIKNIWKNAKQSEFRKHAIDYDVNDPYFFNMGNSHQKNTNGCLLCCDNLGLNLLIDGKLKKHKG